MKIDRINRRNTLIVYQSSFNNTRLSLWFQLIVEINFSAWNAMDGNRIIILLGLCYHHAYRNHLIEIENNNLSWAGVTSKVKAESREKKKHKEITSAWFRWPDPWPCFFTFAELQNYYGTERGMKNNTGKPIIFSCYTAEQSDGERCISGILYAKTVTCWST